MSYHPRAEIPTRASFVTTRTRRQRLWFANNTPVEQHTLALLAKLSERYKAKIFAFALQGTHAHQASLFPLMNRAHFMRDLNSGIACAVARLTPHYPGGPLWHRRYSLEHIWEDLDLEAQFFYTVLQPVKDGLVPKLSEYPFYNCFYDAVRGIERKFKLVNWTRYNEARRYDKNVSIKDFVETYTLKYERLPGYEDLSQRDYRLLMEKKLEQHRLRIIEERIAAGKLHFIGREALLAMKPGEELIPSEPKEVTRNTFRPRMIARGEGQYPLALQWYFDFYYAYKHASKRYRAGDIMYEFPPGTYRPMAPPPLHIPQGPFSVIGA
jgi:REP element-mobilizing transposase RayT